MTAADSLERIRREESLDSGLNAFVSLAGVRAVETAVGSLSEVGRGTAGNERGVLGGRFVAVKDNLVTLDLPVTCGSNMLAGYRSPFEATAVRLLRKAGGIVVGKTNMDEFGMGSSTENSAWGPTLNPHDRTRVPGGSSGGSAAAVAAGYVSMALGSDTGGSVRQPAALCGVVGIKPTYGRVSRYGLVAFASSLDQIGTFGGSVHDAATLLAVISGHDRRDATSANRPPLSLADIVADPDAQGLAGITIGVPVEYFPDTLDTEVRSRTDRALYHLRAAGATVREVTLPNTDLAVPCYYVLAPAEASSNLARFDGVRFGQRVSAGSLLEMYQATRGQGMGLEVKRRIMLGTFALSAGYYDAYYGTAQRARVNIRADFERVFGQGVDLIFTPTTPSPAFRIGEKIDDPLAMYRQDIFTTPASLAGIPAMSVPIGSVQGLPVGGQLLAPWWEEVTMIQAARVLEATMNAS